MDIGTNAQSGLTEIVTKTIVISRKLYDQLASNPVLTYYLTRLFGVQVENISPDFACQQQQQQAQRCPSAVPEQTLGESLTEVRPQQVAAGQISQRKQAKGRREYLIRLVGTHQQVANARQEISKMLGKANIGDRMTLKIDVSFADHSFIIGRNGKGTKTVMRVTGTQVHFPDSNKNNESEKSNQVSVTGSPDQVLRSRKMLRERLPVSFTFFVDRSDCIKAAGHWERSDAELITELRKRFVKLQNEFRVSITWEFPSRHCGAKVTVRGGRNNFEHIREGVRQLIRTLRPNYNRLPPVALDIDVSPHHLNFVLGPFDVNVRYLMLLTNTKVQVVFAREDRVYHIPSIRIIGEIDCVFEAWTNVMDLLPATWILDIAEISPNAAAGEAELSYSNDSGIADSTEETPRLIERSNASRWPAEKTPEEGGAVIAIDRAQSRGATALNSHRNVAGKYNGTVAPALREITRVVSVVHNMLADYNISVHLRLNRDSRQWKIAAKGPEKYVTLFVDVYRAFSKPDPIAFVREAIMKAGPPICYMDEIKAFSGRQTDSTATGGHDSGTIYDPHRHYSDGLPANVSNDGSAPRPRLTSRQATPLVDNPQCRLPTFNVKPKLRGPYSGYSVHCGCSPMSTSASSVTYPPLNTAYLSPFEDAVVAAYGTPSRGQACFDKGMYNSAASFGSLGGFGSLEVQPSPELSFPISSFGFPESTDLWASPAGTSAYRLPTRRGSRSALDASTPPSLDQIPLLNPQRTSTPLLDATFQHFASNEFTRQRGSARTSELPSTPTGRDRKDFAVRGPFGVLCPDDRRGSNASDYLATGDKWSVHLEYLPPAFSADH